MLAPFSTLMESALANHHIVGFFEAWEQYSLEAVIEAAEELNAPVIAGFGESVINTAWFHDRGVEEVAAMGKSAAERSSAEIGLIFNEIGTFDHLERGIRAGFNIVMLDSGQLPRSEHLRLTKLVVSAAHAIGVGVEAEFGALPLAQPDGNQVGGRLTNPAEAAAFVRETGIDALSVAVGNVHLMTEGEATLQVDRVKEIYEAVEIPLVLHGGSGLPDSGIEDLKHSGVAKINVGTILKQRFLDGMKDAIQESDESSTIHSRMGSRESTDIANRGKQYMKAEVIRRMKLYTV